MIFNYTCNFDFLNEHFSFMLYLERGDSNV